MKEGEKAYYKAEEEGYAFNKHAVQLESKWASQKEEMLAKFDELQYQLALLKANQRFVFAKMYHPRVAELLQLEEDSDDDEAPAVPPPRFKAYGRNLLSF